jgi:formylglycine-generating enzyme required for sulfatase activity
VGSLSRNDWDLPWRSSAGYVRSAQRGFIEPGSRDSGIGFRLARNQPTGK